MSDKGLIALHVDYNVVLSAHLLIGLPATVRTATMLSRGHNALATECLDSLAYALIVRSHHYTLHNTFDLLIDALDDQLTSQPCKGLSGKASRGVTRRDDGYKSQVAHILFYFKANSKTCSMRLT